MHRQQHSEKSENSKPRQRSQRRMQGNNMQHEQILRVEKSAGQVFADKIESRISASGTQAISRSCKPRRLWGCISGVGEGPVCATRMSPAVSAVLRIVCRTMPRGTTPFVIVPIGRPDLPPSQRQGTDNCHSPSPDPPRMSTDKKTVTRRKKHRNSKLGCATCKRRRVKCMEDLPACTNCVKHRVHCDYLDFSEEQVAEFKRAHAAHHEAMLELDRGDEKAANVDAERENEPVDRADLTADSMEKAADGSGYLLLAAQSLLEALPASFGQEFPGNEGGERLPMRLSLDGDLEDAGQNLAENIVYSAVPPAAPLALLLNSTAPFDHMAPIASSIAHVQPPAPHAVFHPYARGVSDVLNFQSNAITTNFDNLLADDNGQIIYPVYRIHNDGGSGTHDESLIVEEPAGPFGLLRDVFNSPQIVVGLLEVEHTNEMWRLPSPPPPPLPAFLAALPGALRASRSFAALPRVHVNHEAVLFSVTAKLFPEVTKGRASLDDIRQLYHVWLNYFMSKSWTLPVMFLCLVNLTTNYLITNVFTTRNHNFDLLVLQTRLRNTLIVHLIKHYARVITSLRLLLNKNSDPEMAALVLYILSLMAIYDPEATAHSTKCFRDGLFSVLNYTLHAAQRKGVDPPRLIPIHFQLMTNVVRTVYLPAYSPAFLGEYQQMLARLGSILDLLRGPHGGSAGAQSPTSRFVLETFDSLHQICAKTINEYIPEIEAHPADIAFQEETFFLMFREWANFQPARLLVLKETSDPLECVVNVFLRLFRKSVFAVFPQVRFHFLRDFDSPLMLDVFTPSKDTDVYDALDNPQTLCMPLDMYKRIQPELKVLAAYAIRLITFFSIRLKILYANIVFRNNVRQLYPIKNTLEWRKGITNIEETRREFHQRVGLTEYCVEIFNDTYISPLHYPQIVFPGLPEGHLATPRPPPNDGEGGLVDWGLLQPYGLLKLDLLPPPE